MIYINDSRHISCKGADGVRRVYKPGDDLTAAPAEVVARAADLWTPEVVVAEAARVVAIRNARAAQNAPADPARPLSDAEFKAMLWRKGWDDIWRGIEAAMALSADPEVRALLPAIRAQREADLFHLDRVWGFLEMTSAIAADVLETLGFPPDELTEANVRAAWAQAAG